MKVTRVMKGNEYERSDEKGEAGGIYIKRVRNRRDSNGKLIHRARSSYFSALGVAMNIKPARMNPTTTTTTRSEFRRVRRCLLRCVTNESFRPSGIQTAH